MRTELVLINENFESQLKEIDYLINFDQLILEFCLENLKSLKSRIEQGPVEVNNSIFLPDDIIQSLENIQSNGSFELHYQEIHNQCLVLMVSNFILAIERVFLAALKFHYDNHSFSDVAKRKITLSLLEFEKIEEDSLHLGKILKSKGKVTFQNIPKILETFENYLGIVIPNSSSLENISFAIETRHLIVHCQSIADEKFIKKCKQINKRTLKNQVVQRDKISFNKDELKLVRETMSSFVKDLIKMFN